MLRKRQDSGLELSKTLLYEDFEDNSFKTSIHSVPSITAVVLIILSVLLYESVVKLGLSTPTPLKIEDEVNYPNSFIAERAQNHLHRLVSIGQKITGSYENEVLAVDFLKREISFVIQQANRNQKIELDHQIVSGSYYLAFHPYGLVNIYENVQNIVVRVASANNSEDSLLINCHFDSVPSSPGASDDGINCMAMLETLRVLGKESVRPVHNIIFLFNGAEENPLQAAHGFISQHKWAKECRAVINLEAAGSGGREVLFQAGPGNSFLVNYYSKVVPHPFAQSSGEEIFQSNLIPSDTDFRIFRDFGGIPGLDSAFAQNGYVYHTKYDDFDIIPPGSYQHVGDNLLALVKGLSAAPELPHATLTSKEKTVYFDFIGLYMFTYSEKAAYFINLAAVLASIIISFKGLINMKQGSIFGIFVTAIISAISQVIGWALAVLFCVFVANILDFFKVTMSWYTQPKVTFGLYFCPTLIFASLLLYLMNRFSSRHTHLSIGTRTQLHSHSINLIWTSFLFISTFLIVRGSYIFLIPVIFNIITFLIIYILKVEHTSRTWLYIYLLNSIIPTVFSMYLTSFLLQVFIPITGRFGSNRNPEIVVGIMSCAGCILISNFFIPLITLLKKPTQIFTGLLLIFLTTFSLVVFTQYGFPYDDVAESPTPQRYWVFHTAREFHDASGEIMKKDSGYFLLNMDRNSPHMIKKYVSEIDDAVSLKEDCETVIFCGLPIYISRMLVVMEESTWIPAPSPTFHEPANLRLISKTPISNTTTRYTFNATGPDHYSIFLSPKPNVKLVGWSFFEEIPEDNYKWQNRPTYFIMYGYGLLPSNPYQFWLDMETPVSWKQPVMDIVISGKYVHHEKSRTKHYQQFLNKFPRWAHATAWMTSYNSWIY